MLKLIELDDSFFKDEPVVRIIDSAYSKGLTKQASDSRIADYASSIEAHPGRIYVHILAMGAGEYYGANRNADYFPEDNLIACYKTFETSPAHIFKHHINKDPTIAIGQVVFSVYNERMHRVEIIAWIDRNKGRDYVQRIERNEFPATSMACHTPYDTCAICHNQARSRNEYCVHLKSQLGRILPDGKKVMAINDGPLKFFDMSMVFKPAEPISSVMQKLASANSTVLGSAENAEDSGLVEKQAKLKKLSELIKEIEGEVVGSSDSAEQLLARVKDPSEDVIKFLVHYEIDHVLHAFAELGISPSVSFFAKLIGEKMCGDSVSGIEHLINGVIYEEPEAVNVPELPVMEPPGQDRVGILNAIAPFVKSASLYPEMIMQRAMHDYGTPYGPIGQEGYANREPEEDPREAYNRLKHSVEPEAPGLLKTLFTIAGAAIAAKWLLSRMIDNKMRELAVRNYSNSRQPIKISLVKSAEEALTTQRLAKASLLRDLKIHN